MNNPIREELTTHIAQRTDDLIAQGLSPDVARRQAHEEFGALAAYEAQCRREQRLGGIARLANGLSADVAHAWRRLRATPLFTIFAIASLAVGIGVTTAAYAIAGKIFWKGTGIARADNVVFVFANSPYRLNRPTYREALSEPDARNLIAAQRTLSHVAVSRPFVQGVQYDGTAEVVSGEAVAGDYFETLGVQPLLGRPIRDEDDQQRAAVALVSHTFWRTRLGGRRDVIGGIVRLAGHPFEILGVMPPEFDGLSLELSRPTGVWIPAGSLNLFPHFGSSSTRPPRERRSLTIVGRLAAGQSAEAASADINAIGRGLDSTDPIRVVDFSKESSPGVPELVPGTRNWHVRTVEQTYTELTDVGRRTGAILVFLIGLVFLVACSNLANLNLARGAARANDLHVRRALGASRWRLLREQCVESTIIAAAGALGALLVARYLVATLGSRVVFGQGFSVQVDSGFDGGTFLFLTIALIAALLVFGAGPALQLTRTGSWAGLMRGSIVATGDPKRARTQRRLIRVQVAVACAFFVVSTLAMQAVMRQARHDPGIDLDRLALGTMNFSVQRWAEARGRRTMDAALEAARSNPALQSAAVSSGMPFGTTFTPGARLVREGEPFRRGQDVWAAAMIASPEIFRTLGVDILKGRAFDARDGAGSASVVVLSAKTALELFGTTQALDRHVDLHLETRRNPAAVRARVIGIASDTDIQFLTRRNSGGIYLPVAQQFAPAFLLVGRASAGTEEAVKAVREALRGADPLLASEQVSDGFTRLAGFFHTARMAAIAATSLGLLALVLSMVGLHGVLAQVVTSRTREVGLRVALGAERSQIMRMVLRDGLQPALQGMLIGIFLGILGRFVLRATAYPMLPVFDALTFVAIPIPVLLAGVLACYLPARRAAAVDPNIALRAL